MFLSRNKKNNVYPCKPQFYYIKVGFKGVNIIWACFRDDFFNVAAHMCIHGYSVNLSQSENMCSGVKFHFLHNVSYSRIIIILDSFGAKFQTTFVQCFIFIQQTIDWKEIYM